MLCSPPKGCSIEFDRLVWKKFQKNREKRNKRAGRRNEFPDTPFNALLHFTLKLFPFPPV